MSLSWTAVFCGVTVLQIIENTLSVPVNFDDEIKNALNDLNTNQSTGTIKSAINIHITDLLGGRTVKIDSVKPSDDNSSVTNEEKNSQSPGFISDRYEVLMNKSLLDFQSKLDVIFSKVDSLELKLEKSLKQKSIDGSSVINNSESQKISGNQAKKIIENANESPVTYHKIDVGNSIPKAMNSQILGGIHRHQESPPRAKRKSENRGMTQIKKPRVLSLYARFIPVLSDDENSTSSSRRRSKRIRRNVLTVGSRSPQDATMFDWLIASPEYQQRLLRTWLASKHYQGDVNLTDVKLLYHVTKPAGSDFAHGDQDHSKLETGNLRGYGSETSSDMDFDHSYEILDAGDVEIDETDFSTSDRVDTSTESIWDILWS